MLKTLKKYLFTGFIVCIISVPVSAAQQLDSVVAIVNDSVITQSQINAMMFNMRRMLKASGAPVPSNPELRKKALDQLIGESLQFQVAARNNITASDADVTRTIDSIAAQNGISTEQLKQALAKEGVNYNKFRTQIHNQIVVRELQRGLFGGKVTVTDQEAKDYIKAHPIPANPNSVYKLDDLLVPVSESASEADIEAVKQKAAALLAKAQKGESFSQLVAADSSLEQNDLGWRNTSQLPALFADKVSTLQVGGLAGPIKAGNGFHILKLVEKQGGAAQISIEQAKNMVYQSKIEKKLAEWVRQARESAYVKIME
jgi:peptidyl-prolyl cis-trans isomerase SurA